MVIEIKDDSISLKKHVFPFRNMQDLVKVRKPVVQRKGRVVEECNFYKETGQCFGRRCFWTQHGVCPFYEGFQKKK